MKQDIVLSIEKECWQVNDFLMVEMQDSGEERLSDPVVKFITGGVNGIDEFFGAARGYRDNTYTFD